MQKVKSWKLRHLIACGYVIPILAMGLSAIVTVVNLNIVREKSALSGVSNVIDNTIGDLEVDIQALSGKTRGYLIDKNPISLEAAEQARKEVGVHRNQLEKLIQDEKQKQNLATLNTELEEYLALNSKILDFAKVHSSEEALNFWKKQNERHNITALTNAVDAMDARETQIVKMRHTEEDEAINLLQTTVLAAAAVSLILSFVFGVWIVRRTASRMDESTSDIAASTSEIAATIEQQERTATQQAASVNETTTTMDELGASSRQSAEQAESAAAGAQQALMLADRGTKAVDHTLEGMALLKQKVEAIAGQILRLSEQTNQIGSISGLVSDLANQTNMLALNAAVEAVRAGEHGKGFAVVAAEIRKLADQSKRSAEKINVLVSDIQSAINSTVMVTDEGTKTVEEGVRVAQETADSFKGVTDAVNNVVLNSQQISLNVRQQAIAVQQVVEAMNSLNIAARETAAGISQIRVGTERLNEATLDLKALV